MKTIKVGENDVLNTMPHRVSVLYNRRLPPVACDAHTALPRRLDSTYNDARSYVSIYLLVSMLHSKWQYPSPVSKIRRAYDCHVIRTGDEKSRTTLSSTSRYAVHTLYTCAHTVQSVQIDTRLHLVMYCKKSLQRHKTASLPKLYAKFVKTVTYTSTFIWDRCKVLKDKIL